MYTSGSIANSKGMLIKINESGAIVKVGILVENDTAKHSKTFTIISSEMLILLFILCWLFFSCLQMYSDKFFNIYFHELQNVFSNICVQGRQTICF